MIQAQPRAYGLGIPSPLDHWIDATLRVFAELVRNVARFFGTKSLGMRPSRPAAECHSEVTPAPLPRENGNSNSNRSSSSRSTTGSTSCQISEPAGEAGLIGLSTSHRAARAMSLPLEGGGATRTSGWSAKIRRGSLSTAHAGKDPHPISPASNSGG